MKERTTSSGGIGFLGALTILFIALKLIGTITWSWWWVLAPMWIPIAAVLVILFVAFGFFGLVGLVAGTYNKNKGKDEE